jgi:short-subunit dehydrogenase
MNTVIVTGASSGIGRTAAIQLINAGYRVFGLARSFQKLQDISSGLPSNLSVNFFPFEFDITRPETFDDTISKILSNSASKDLYALVNNAGYVEPGAIEDLTMDALRLEFETNFFGLVGFTKKILPVMLKNHSGRIVNVSSMAGLISLPMIGAYCASKHAVEAIADALRAETWNTGIHVININPGLIETNIHSVTISRIALLKQSRFRQAYSKYLENIPKGLPPSAVATVIEEAISSPNPKLRYFVGSPRERIGIRLKPLLPDRLFFQVLAKRLIK